ncbi:MarR family winged helix-turn-helix transcriptional regulator [Shouchella shacheensis]|uniref:MarR family winged helix-turn-helix transcriptional regulator n=1 Tax=Shouchella shacheensis TaxID=1649580 RepID=UPI00073FED96|nr:MarR family winged helix-turn-helix transcriptional regulator [Shouchella shacheensis]
MNSFKKDERLALTLWFRLARFYHESNRMSNQHVRKWGISLSQFDTLVQVRAFQPVAQGELAEKLLVTKGNMTHTLTKLESCGYITRKQEWRTKTIALTENGAALVAEVMPEQSAFQASLFEPLKKEEQKQLLELMRKLQKQTVVEEFE